MDTRLRGYDNMFRNILRNQRVKSIELYRQLTGKIGEYESKLLSAYAGDISCTRGCSACCILESVFPVEAYNIYESMTDGESLEQVRSSGCEEGKCVFLREGECSIYRYRPVICRTHGYPVLVEGRVDFCSLNFKNIKNIDSGFILDVEALNRALVSINLAFLGENDEEFFSTERIVLADLKNRILLNT
jgi:hypothetical protein